MKTFSILWSLLVGSLIFGSCEVDDLASPAKENRSELTERKGASQNSTVVYGGQATGLNATITTLHNGTVVSNQTILSQTGLLPVSGGNLNSAYSQAFIEGSLSIESLNASVSGQANQTVSFSSATNLYVTVDGNVITADYAEANATTTCGTASGSVQVQNLVVNGTLVVVTGTPNQMVYLSSGGFLIINEQSSSKKVKAKNISVTALHIIIPNGADIRIATARSEVKC